MNVLIAAIYGCTILLCFAAYAAIARPDLLGLVVVTAPLTISGSAAMLMTLDFAASSLRRLWS